MKKSSLTRTQCDPNRVILDTHGTKTVHWGIPKVSHVTFPLLSRRLVTVSELCRVTAVSYECAIVVRPYGRKRSQTYNSACNQP